MIGRILFENESWVLTASLLGRYKIIFKESGISRKASREEGRHFLRVIL